jgi:DNA repair protein RadD
MSYVLRDYQEHAVERGTNFLLHGNHPGGLIVLPTGAGKSLVIAGIASKLDGPCLIFQPSREILQQNATKLLAYGFEPKIFSASMGEREIGQITLATIGSVKDCPTLFNDFPYVMVDEAHLVNAKSGMYRVFFEALDDIRILGLTATPYRLSSDGYGGSQLKFLTRTRPKVFHDVVAYAQIRDLIEAGYLARPLYQPVPGFSRGAVKLNTTGADYDEDSLRRHYNQIGFNDRLRRVILRLLEVGRKNVLVFTRFVDDAMRLAEVVPGMAVVSAKTKPTMRTAIVEGFRTGKIPVVANVGVLGLGFDYPELETVVLARPTVSLSLYYQQVGRLLRPHPAKGDPWVVDMVDQVNQFGRIEDLWLQPGGASGKQWEMVTRGVSQTRALTNVYFGGPPHGRPRWSARKGGPTQKWYPRRNRYGA